MDSEAITKRLIDGLESGELLPKELRAKVVKSEYRLALPEGQMQIDLIVEFAMGTGNLRVGSAIECKSRVSPLEVQLIAQRLKRTTEVLRTLLPTMASEPCLMIAAPYLSESTQDACKKLGLGYIDLNGNLYLASNGIHFDIFKPSKQFRPEQGLKSIYSGKSRRILRTLLCQPGIRFRLDNIARDADTSVAQASYVMRRLEEDRFVERDRSGTVLMKPGKLLKTFATEAKNDFRKNRKISYAISRDDSLSALNRLENYCNSKSIKYAFALFSGLESYERQVLENVSAVYVSTDPQKIAEDMRFPIASKGANLYIMQPPPSDDTAEGGIFYRPRILANGIKAVNLIQAYLDFTYYPGRGEEQARYIFERLLGFTE